MVIPLWMSAGHFDNTLGAGFIGCILTAILYGVTCIQCFMYSQNSERDSKLLRCSILVLWVLDSFHMALVAHTIYWYTITNFTDPTVVGRIPWTIPAGILVTPLSDTIVRIFFTYRVWILSRGNIWLTGTITFGVVAMFGIGFGFGIKGFSLPTFEQLAEIAWLLYLGLALVVVVDAFIALSLCIYLWRSRRGFNMRTDSLITLLMVYTVNTGLLTSFFSLACFITYAAMPKNYVFLALYFPLSKLYINALLATLNARESLKRETHRGTSTGSTSGPLRNIRLDNNTISLELKGVSQMEPGVGTEQDLHC